MDPPFGVFPHARVRREAHRTAAEAAALPKKSTALLRLKREHRTWGDMPFRLSVLFRPLSHNFFLGKAGKTRQNPEKPDKFCRAVHVASGTDSKQTNGLEGGVP